MSDHSPFPDSGALNSGESKTCAACGAQYYGHPCPLCNLKVRPRYMAEDHGISPAQRVADLELKSLRVSDEINAKALDQLREKVEALEKRCDVLDAQLSHALVSIAALNQQSLHLAEALKRIEELERDMNDVHTNALSTRGF